MSTFMVSNQLMQEVVTAILQNTDDFATIQTFRDCLVDDLLTETQREAAEQIGKRLFAMNAAAIKARYGTLPQRLSFEFGGWADATPVEQFKAISCLLHQACEGSVPNGRLYSELNRVAGELAQRIVQDSPDTRKPPGADRHRAGRCPFIGPERQSARAPERISMPMESPT